jgi:hypothetical protein
MINGSSGGRGMEKNGEKPRQNVDSSIKRAMRDSELLNSLPALLDDPIVVQALGKAMDNPEIQPSSRHLIELIQERHADSLKQKGDAADYFKPEKKEMIRRQVMEDLERRHSELIEDIEGHSRRHKDSVQGSKDSIAELEFRFSLLNKYGVDIITEFIAENQEKYPTSDELKIGIKHCLDELYGRLPRSQDLFTQISREIKCGTDSGIERSMLKSLGVRTDEPDWRKSLNACDLHDLEREMQLHGASEYANISKTIFEKDSELVKTYLRDGDLSGIREIIKGMIEPKFKETFGKMTADTPDRRKERMLFPLVGHGLYKNTGVGRGFELQDHVQRIWSRKSEAPLGDWEFGEVRRLLMEFRGGSVRTGKPEYVRKSMEVFLEKYGEELVKKVGMNYEIADPGRFEELVREQYDQELEEAVNQVVARRRKENTRSE